MANVTYGRLDTVLRALGFSSRIAEDKARVYEHAPSGASIILPTLPFDDDVRPWHMNMVQRTLEGFGLADPLDLDARLQKAS